MTREQMLAQADRLDAEAEVNDAYRAAMRATDARTHGMLGHRANPSTYAAHGLAAATKRLRAADLRAAADKYPRAAALRADDDSKETPNHAQEDQSE